MFGRFFRLLRLTVLLVILLAVIIFTVSNRGEVDLSLYPLPFEISLPVYLFFLLSLGAGYLWGMFSNSVAILRHKHTAKKQTAKATALSDEISVLRAEQSVSTSAAISAKNE